MLELHISFTDHSRAFTPRLRAAALAGLEEAAEYAHGRIRRVLGRQAPRTGRGRYQGAPVGQPPRRRTGRGQRAVFWDSNGNPRDPRVIVGVTREARYMLYHELGIRGQKRPWLVPTIERHRAAMSRIIRLRSRLGSARLGTRGGRS